LSAVNVAETLLVFVGAPLAVIVLLVLLIFLPGGRGRTRYKSGQPWEHEPVWYEPHPEHGPAGGGHGETQAIGSSVYGELTDGHGTSAPDGHGTTSAAPRPVSAGPLGGARGTW
jgi:membrane-associated phospholipid phosphatase